MCTSRLIINDNLSKFAQQQRNRYDSNKIIEYWDSENLFEVNFVTLHSLDIDIVAHYSGNIDMQDSYDKLVLAKWLITMFQTLWPRRVTMLWHLCQSTLSRPHQTQWVWVNFCCSSSSLPLGADVLKYELCVYSPVLFEAPCCSPSSKCHTGMSTTFKY